MTRRDRSGRRVDPARLPLFAGPLASLIIGLAGVVATRQYNSGQLQVARTKEMAKIIRQLSSNDHRKRVMASAVLGLYGEEAIPALLALTENAKPDVSEAAVGSLVQIGEPARKAVVERYCQPPRRKTRSSISLSALNVVGRLGGNECDETISAILTDDSESPGVRIDAVEAACSLGDARFTPLFRAIARQGAAVSSLLAEWVTWCLGEIGETESAIDLLPMVEHENAEVRAQAYRALRKLRNPAVEARVCSEADKENQRRDSSILLQSEARKFCPAGTE